MKLNCLLLAVLAPLALMGQNEITVTGSASSSAEVRNAVKQPRARKYGPKFHTTRLAVEEQLKLVEGLLKKSPEDAADYFQALFESDPEKHVKALTVLDQKLSLDARHLLLMNLPATFLADLFIFLDSKCAAWVTNSQHWCVTQIKDFKKNDISFPGNCIYSYTKTTDTIIKEAVKQRCGDTNSYYERKKIGCPENLYTDGDRNLVVETEPAVYEKIPVFECISLVQGYLWFILDHTDYERVYGQKLKEGVGRLRKFAIQRGYSTVDPNEVTPDENKFLGYQAIAIFPGEYQQRISLVSEVLKEIFKKDQDKVLKLLLNSTDYEKNVSESRQLPLPAKYVAEILSALKIEEFDYNPFIVQVLETQFTSDKDRLLAILENMDCKVLNELLPYLSDSVYTEVFKICNKEDDFLDIMMGLGEESNENYLGLPAPSDASDTETKK